MFLAVTVNRKNVDHFHCGAAPASSSQTAAGHEASTLLEKLLLHLELRTGRSTSSTNTITSSTSIPTTSITSSFKSKNKELEEAEGKLKPWDFRRSLTC
ncbi:uncharacterized protein V6R79_007997 [Siganus canaliculatus]